MRLCLSSFRLGNRPDELARLIDGAAGGPNRRAAVVADADGH